MIAKIENLRPIAFLLVAWFFAGCERSTHIRIEGGTAPVFVLSGSGELAIFVVYGPDYITKAENPFDESFALWEIKPSAGYLAGTPVGELKRITYGVVPDGYVQVRPQLGSAPPLMEGQKYFYSADTTDATGVAGFVEIRNARAVPTQVQGPCFGRRDKKWIRVPCSQ